MQVIICPLEILTDERLTDRDRRVLLAIFSWRKANTNLSRVSRSMISERARLPLTRVSAVTARLESLGWLKKHGNGGRSQWIQYEICDVAENSNQNSNRYQNGNGYQNSNQTVTKTVTPGVTKTVTPIDTERNNRSNTEEEKKEKSEKLKIQERISAFKKIAFKECSPSESEITEFNKFFDYWTEHNPQGSKIRFETQKIFNVKQRWKTWQKNTEKWRPKLFDAKCKVPQNYDRDKWLQE